MYNLHLLIRQELYEQLKGKADLCPADICTNARPGEASFPLGYRTALPAQRVLEEVMRGLAAREGGPLIDRAWMQGGHACFSVSAGAYASAMRHILSSVPLPSMPDPVRGDVEYAICRMHMLSRQGGQGCPEDAPVRRALWLAWGIVDAEPARRETQRRRAADALLNMLRGRPYPARAALRTQLGEVGGCAARLLCHN
ncbi:MAG: hypothetical protein LBN26_09645 [Christensenellaceae bacterium]|jgi:hypothetical protein|nr:hypothetical protein [Christensenellaceae bacterium]